MGVREQALAPRRRTALGALLRVPLRGAGQRVAPNGSRNAGAAPACRGPGLRRELGRNVGTGRRLCLAHCGDLAFPGRERAPQLEKAAETEDFSPVPGAHHTSAAVNARRSPGRGDGSRAARSVRHSRRGGLESWGRTI